MPSKIRLILLILSITITIILFIYHIISFYKYAKRGKYQYESLYNQTYKVVKKGYTIQNCTLNGTTYTYGEVDWLIIRSKGHYIFLACFWGALLLAFFNSVCGAMLEYVLKSDVSCLTKFLRILRSVVYKSSISIPVMVLFAFNYRKPCLELRKTTLMLFSNRFTYITLAIQIPVLIFVLIDVLYEFYSWKLNATYILLKGSIKGQPIGQKILRIFLFTLLFLFILGGILLCFVIHLELLVLTDLTHLSLVIINILISVFNICDS